MDDSIDSPHPVIRWFQNLPEPQRRIAPVVALAIVIAGGWFATRRPSAGTPLALPQGLAPAAAIAHLNERGIDGVQAAGASKISVPQDQSAEAKRFLDELAVVSTTWADEWEKSNAQLGQFSGNRERESAKEIARARMIGRLLRQMPGIAQADVVWDEEESQGWRAPQRTRCTVYLRPKTGFEITADMARSVRQAVAGSKSHLATEDIVVMDLDRMTAFDAVPSGVDELARTVAEREVLELRREIELALSDCPGVRVNVGMSWREKPEETTIELSPVSHRGSSAKDIALVAANGFLEQLSTDEIGDFPSRFEPLLQVTVSVPEDAAAKWAQRRTAPLTADRVIKAQFERPLKARAADTIRQSVGAVLARADRRNLATGVAVHLTPALGLATVVESVPEEKTIDPLWFLAMALAGCIGGAWVLSSAFSRTSKGTMGDEHPATVQESVAAAEHVRPATAKPALALHRPDDHVVEFEDLIDCPSEFWNELWRLTRPDDWAAALKGASTQLRTTILNSLSPEATGELEQLLASAPAFRLAQIDAAQESLRITAAELLERV